MITLDEARKMIGSDDCFPAHIGWLRSYIERVPVDKDGHPIPWYTYAIIDFLIRGRIKPTMRVLEYGSGYSSLFWMRRVAYLESVEDNEAWHKIISEMAAGAANFRYHLKQPPHYAMHGLQIDEADLFDIVCIDGAERVNCAFCCPHALKPDGVVIWDNSCDPLCNEGYAHLAELGFKRIDFWGFTPVCTVGSCTSIFYRRNNCMGI